MGGNIIDLNLCLLIGQIGNDFKYMKCSNGKQMATFSLCINSFYKELADSTERTHSQTYIRVLCFDKAQIEYLRKVNAHQGQRAFVVSRLSSFKNEYRGNSFMTNGVVCRSITILKSSEDKSIMMALEAIQTLLKQGEMSQKAYETIVPLLGKGVNEEIIGENNIEINESNGE